MGQKFSLDESSASEAQELLGQMPDVSEHAIASAQENASEEAPATAPAAAPANTDDKPNPGDKDEQGTPFNPEIHTGSKLVSGRWRERKKSVVAAPRGKKTAAASQPSAADVKRAENEAQCRACGVVAAGTMFMLCRGVMGEEWTPSNDEIEMQNQNWGNYFVAKGIQDIPPGAALFMGIAAYAAPRFTKPQTQAKVGAAKTWFMLRVARWKVRRELKKRGIAADVTIRDGDIFINGTSAKSWSEESKPARKS